jgi:hypothetical protein
VTRKKKPTTSLVRSSAAEYLTFVAASGSGGVEAVYANENVWLSQKVMVQLYDVDVRTINYHLKTIFTDSELEEDAVIQTFRITAADGKTYDTKHYNLSAIIAVGYKVNSERAVQFRKWATRVVEEFTVKGFAMDDERLKRGGSVLSDRYFEEQLQRVREIRLSERKFYQKITDIYATSVDYDVTAQATKRFFAAVQNKLHWAIHGQTAAEVIVDRADATKEHMGLNTWTDAPHGKIQKFDVIVAKNSINVTPGPSEPATTCLFECFRLPANRLKILAPELDSVSGKRATVLGEVFASTEPQTWSGRFHSNAQLEPGRIDLGLKRVLHPDNRVVTEGLRPARCELRGHGTARVLDVAQELRGASELFAHRRQRVAVGLAHVANHARESQRLVDELVKELHGCALFLRRHWCSHLR